MCILGRTDVILMYFIANYYKISLNKIALIRFNKNEKSFFILLKQWVARTKIVRNGQ